MKKDLILLHGALGAAKEFERFVLDLSEHFNVYSFDFSGHGNNDSTEKFSMSLFAENLKDFIIANELDRPQIFGYSMGGYVAYTLAIKEPDLLGDIMSLGTKLKWDVLTAKAETKKLNPQIIEEKVPKFAQYLDSLHLDWKQNMLKTVDLMIDLGNGAALELSDFSKVQNKCFIGLGDHDEMVSCRETNEVHDALPNSHYYSLINTRHPLNQIDKDLLVNQIIEFLG
ncbi:alpha/beta hydrolase [Paracrocinitomix mangrovi]|uniref:alpha/beta fold hydrolase n=1 Tax=Paracrocinitomix mangrovi TaxID=2862509 RepID=UPI001C8E8161|nr:alpha/beta hydrolase [Paracrocinitomix mangrovi]UKN03677.1 alpha/beta hydrolase [Paracrocinitomix mangrovi]